MSSKTSSKRSVGVILTPGFPSMCTFLISAQMVCACVYGSFFTSLARFDFNLGTRRRGGSKVSEVGAEGAIRCISYLLSNNTLHFSPLL